MEKFLNRKNLFEPSRNVGLAVFSTSNKNFFSTQQNQNNKQWIYMRAGVRSSLKT